MLASHTFVGVLPGTSRTLQYLPVILAYRLALNHSKSGSQKRSSFSYQMSHAVHQYPLCANVTDLEFYPGLRGSVSDLTHSHPNTHSYKKKKAKDTKIPETPGIFRLIAYTGHTVIEMDINKFSKFPDGVIPCQLKHAVLLKTRHASNQVALFPPTPKPFPHKQSIISFSFHQPFRIHTSFPALASIGHPHQPTTTLHPPTTSRSMKSPLFRE